MARRALITASAGVLLLVTAIGAPAATSAKVYKVSATLTAGAEVPPQKVKQPRAAGTFAGTFNPVTSKLRWTLTFHGLTGQATAAHIHLGATGKAGPVVIPLCGPCKSGQNAVALIGGGAATGALIGIRSAYVNVHTAANPAGEIRGVLRVRVAST